MFEQIKIARHVYVYIQLVGVLMAYNSNIRKRFYKKYMKINGKKRFTSM